jgi:hypothetical protein
MQLSKNISLLLLLTSLSTIISAQATVVWNNYPGGVSIAIDQAENVFTANWDFNPAGDITLTKRDNNGNILWEVGYDNIDNTRHEVSTWVDADQQGNCIVAGTIRSGISSPVNVNSLLMKFSTQGNLIWRIVYDTDFDGSNTVKCLVDEFDQIYVLGIGNSGNGMRTQVRKFSPDGDALWTYFDMAGLGFPQNIKLTKDNAILLTHRNSSGFVNGYSKINTAGNLLWSVPGINSASSGDASGDENGNTYLVNGNYELVNPSTNIRKISPAGDSIWQANHSMTAFRVEVGPDNQPVCSGFPNSGTPGVAIIKLDSTGNLLWANMNADGPSYALLAHAMMKIDSTGSTFVAGGTISAMGICKVNAMGISQWAVSAPSGYPSAFELANHSSIYMVGGTTVKLSQDEILSSTQPKSNTFNSAFPNPSNSGELVTLESENVKQIRLLNTTGKCVWDFELKQSTSSVKIPMTESGVYLIEIKYLDGTFSYQKLIRF